MFASILGSFLIISFSHQAEAAILVPYLDVRVVRGFVGDVCISTNTNGEYNFSASFCGNNLIIHFTITLSGYELLNYQE